MIAMLPYIVPAVLAVALLRLAGARGLILVATLVVLLGGGFVFANAGREPRGAETGRPAPGVQSLAPVRHAFIGNFTRSENWMAMADSMAARGKTVDAVGILTAAVKAHPRDYTLWTALGSMLATHGDGLNPAAEMSFDRAIRLAPTYPMPRFYYGIARMQSGDREGALEQWRILLANAPADASWRGLVEDRIRSSR